MRISEQRILHTSKSGNGSLELLKEWADVIGFASREKFVTKSQSDDSRFKARETEKRILRLDGTAAFLAGNRYGLPSHCDLTWASFIAGFSPSTKLTETEKEAA